MNVVLYTQDFEPITILDLPVWLLDQLERQGAVKVAVAQPANLKNAWETGQIMEPDYVQTVTIFCEKLRWHNNQVKTVLVTPDEELALILRPEWLPGQVQAINGYKAAIQHLTQQLVKALRK